MAPYTIPPTHDPAGTSASPDQLRLIGLALLMGAVTFAVVAVALPVLSGTAPTHSGDLAYEGSSSTQRMLSLVNLPLTLSCLGLAFFFGLRAKAQPERALGLLLVRWALLEGAALFGIVVVLMGGIAGLLPGQPAYYANLAGLVIFAVVVLTDLLALDGSRGE